jgi:3-methylfumaryl-CoA hydratase
MTDVPATNDLDILLQWKGRSESLTEAISASDCQKMQNTLDRDATLNTGDELPPLWHFIAHTTSAPQSGLGRDGHPKRGGFLPPVQLPRRMWAGSRLSFDGTIRIGDQVTKTSTIKDVAMKTGRSGSLCFVTVQHELSVEGDIKISEQQDLVYREDPAPDTPAPPPKPTPTDADFSRVITPTEVMLFRFSALTFNGHRIHYDRDYSSNVEGYGGLVFHGPLTATLLADMAVSETGGTLASFSFRGVAPLLDTEPFTISGTRQGQSLKLWATTPSGGLAMDASAELAPES